MGQKIKAMLDVKEQEFEIVGNGVLVADAWHITPDGEIEKCGIPSVHDNTVTLLRLIRPSHTFGGLVFEETGEVRMVAADEWFLFGKHVQHSEHGHVG